MIRLGLVISTLIIVFYKSINSSIIVSGFTTRSSYLTHCIIHNRNYSIQREQNINKGRTSGDGSLFLSSSSSNGNNDNTNGDFDDFSMEEVEAANELTREFYKQIQLREQSPSSSSSASSIESWEVKNKSDSSTIDKQKKQKYTGRFSQGDLDSTGTPSAGLFSTQNGSVYAVPNKRSFIQSSSSASSSSINGNNNDGQLSPRDKMMRQEFNLVSLASNEVSLIVQGVLVSITLFFAIYIGASGGITDGSDRFAVVDGDSSGVIVNEYNGMGESLDFSRYRTDDASTAPSPLIEGLIKEKSSSVWL